LVAVMARDEVENALRPLLKLSPSKAARFGRDWSRRKLRNEELLPRTEIVVGGGEIEMIEVELDGAGVTTMNFGLGLHRSGGLRAV
jgi:hypothetical protein